MNNSLRKKLFAVVMICDILLAICFSWDCGKTPHS